MSAGATQQLCYCIAYVVLQKTEEKAMEMNLEQVQIKKQRDTKRERKTTSSIILQQ